MSDENEKTRYYISDGKLYLQKQDSIEQKYEDFEFEYIHSDENYVFAHAKNLGGEVFDIILGAAESIDFEASEDYISLSAVTNNANETTIYNYAVNNMGLNVAAACGILANIYKESSFNPNALGDNGTSYGICQ